MDTVIIVCQLILSLSILVVTHEFGHFIFAKIFGVRVSKFYMFFNPNFSIFKYIPDGPHKGADAPVGFSFCKYTEIVEEIEQVDVDKYNANPDKYTHLGKDVKVISETIEEVEEKVKGKLVKQIKITRQVKGGFSLISYTREPLPEGKVSKSWWHNTDFGLGWLPLGGYCQIDGMVDETQSAEKMKDKPVEKWEFRAKPAWQRLLIMIGGVAVNLVSAPLIFWFVLYIWGESYVSFSEAPIGLQYHEVMQEAGFQNGDLIVSINGEEVDSYKEIANTILLSDTCTVGIVRNGEPMQIGMPREFYRTILSKDVEQLCALRVPTVVDSVLVGSPAYAAGLVAGDSIIGIDSLRTSAFNEIASAIKSNAGNTVSLIVAREDKSVDTLSVNITADGTIGFTNVAPTRWIKVKTLEYGFFAALPAGVNKGYELLVNYVKQLPLLFTKEGATKVGGFGTIAKIFPESWNWRIFWFNTAFLAIMLAVMNILPIPALDGGFVLFLLVEVITGKKIPDKFMEYAQMVGMMILLMLVLYANGNDVLRYLF
ncbi:MAG: RIP metalloprotease RseP [Bacteroidia bacterium]|nr:RIP metalloprotease RseP [Bacteroidia bacterium]